MLVGGVNVAFQVWQFVQEVVSVALMLIIAGALYIFVFYPKIPQKWGGGRSVPVRLVLAEDKIPLKDANREELFAPSVEKSQDLNRNQELQTKVTCFI